MVQDIPVEPKIRAEENRQRKPDLCLMVTIDTECDKREGWRTVHPLEFESVRRGIPEVLTPIFEDAGVRPTYLLSPEVMRDRESTEILSAVPSAELGTHLHGEFIPPQDDPTAAVTARVQASYTPEVERSKLSNLTSLFRSAFRYAPKSFRGGRFSLSSNSLAFLSELGYTVDSTVTPFRSNYYGEGPVANYWGASLHAYRPSPQDPRSPGPLSILEVPVSILRPCYRTWPRWALRLMNDRAASALARIPGLGLSKETLWARPLRGSLDQQIRAADLIIDQWSGPGPAFINVMFHSNECWVGTSPYTLREEGWQQFKTNLKSLIQHLVQRRQARPVTLGEYGELFCS